ncbi:hypothetical protein N7454_004889 [Penicillium verhagenii]|nr:hypothetical protein N7454_004889 [Penicillium verhagenii]
MSKAMIHPRVGIAVFAMNAEGKFVFGKRKGSHGAGRWALPGGHLEMNEDFAECAAREMLEETGLELVNLKLLTATNDVMLDESRHYVTIFMKGDLKDQSAQPQIMEPEKCDAWVWMSWDEMRTIRDAQLESGEDSQGRKLFSPMMALFKQCPDVSV